MLPHGTKPRSREYRPWRPGGWFSPTGEQKSMTVEYVVSGLVALGLLVYLLYALLKPERF